MKMSAVYHYSRAVRVWTRRMVQIIANLDWSAMPVKGRGCRITATTRIGTSHAGLILGGLNPHYLIRYSGVKYLLVWSREKGLDPYYTCTAIAIHEVRHNIQFCEGLGGVCHASHLQTRFPAVFEDLQNLIPFESYSFHNWIVEYDAYARHLCFLLLCHKGVIECNVDTAREFILRTADELDCYFEQAEQILRAMRL